MYYKPLKNMLHEQPSLAVFKADIFLTNVYMIMLFPISRIAR